MLPSRSLIVLHFTLRFMVHTDLILVEGIRSGSRLLFGGGHVNVQFFQHGLLKK